MYLFLGKLEGDDRDSVLYISDDETGTSISGSAFSRGIEESDIQDMKYSILTEKELKSILENGVTIDIVNKLNSSENEDYYNKTVLPEEIEKLKDKHILNDNEIDYILDYNPTEYKDSAIVITVYKDIEEMAYEKAQSYGWAEDEEASSSCPEQLILHNHQFDYDQFIEDLLDGEDILELTDGRIVYFMI